MIRLPYLFASFFFNDTATTEIYTLSLHDALPIYLGLLPEHFFPKESGRDYALSPYLEGLKEHRGDFTVFSGVSHPDVDGGDRKSTRLNSSHQIISYAVFCLKKKITI